MNKNLGCLAALVQTALAIGLATPAAAAPSNEAEWAVSNQNGLRLSVNLETVAYNPAEVVVEYSLTNNSSAELTMHRVAGDDGTLFRLVAPNGTPMLPKVKPQGGQNIAKRTSSWALERPYTGNFSLATTSSCSCQACIEAQLDFDFITKPPEALEMRSPSNHRNFGSRFKGRQVQNRKQSQPHQGQTPSGKSHSGRSRCT